MLCDNCWRLPADYHVGEGVVICNYCIMSFDRSLVLKKMAERAEMLDRFLNNGYLTHDEMKSIPVELLIPEE